MASSSIVLPDDVSTVAPKAPEEEPKAPEEEQEDETGECMFGNFKTAHPGHEKVLFLHDRFKDDYLKFWLK